MAVSLTIDEVYPPAADIADSLNGGGTGYNVGSVTSGQWGPITNKVSNLGHKNLYIKHDGVNAITELAVSVAPYGTTTGFSYGGDDSANNDYTNVIAQGANSGDSKNSSDNASNGAWIEMQNDVSDANRFDIAARSAFVKRIGNGSLGIDVDTAYTVVAGAMTYDAPGKTNPSAPVDGSLGPSGNTVLGEICQLQLRHYVRQVGAEINSRVQYELILSYAFTS